MTFDVLDQTREGSNLIGYDVGRVREDFPILKQKIHGKPLVFLDSAASAQKPSARTWRPGPVWRTGGVARRRGRRLGL